MEANHCPVAPISEVIYDRKKFYSFFIDDSIAYWPGLSVIRPSPLLSEAPGCKSVPFVENIPRFVEKLSCTYELKKKWSVYS